MVENSWGKYKKTPGKGSQQESVEDPDGLGREMVHFGKGLPPIPRKLVVIIEKESLVVDIADFPVIKEFSCVKQETEEEAGVIKEKKKIKIQVSDVLMCRGGTADLPYLGGQWNSLATTGGRIWGLQEVPLNNGLVSPVGAGAEV